VQGECLLAVDQCLFVVPQQRTVPADGVEGVGLPGPVADGAVQREGPLAVADRLPVPAVPQHPHEAVVGVRLTGRVVEFGVQVEGEP
jgi:hypothetical protein